MTFKKAFSILFAGAMFALVLISTIVTYETNKLYLLMTPREVHGDRKEHIMNR